MTANESSSDLSDETANDSVILIQNNYPIIELSDNDDVLNNEVSVLNKCNISQSSTKRLRRVKKEKNDGTTALSKDCSLKVLKKRKVSQNDCDVSDTPVKKIKTENSDTKILKQEKNVKIKLEKNLIKDDQTTNEFKDTKHRNVVTNKKTRVKVKEEIETENNIKLEKISAKSKAKFESNDSEKPVTVVKSEYDSIKSTSSHSQLKLGSGIEWEASMLAKWSGINQKVAKNIIIMLKNDCTVPFIARYRRAETNNMDADKLRYIKTCYENDSGKKALNALKQIQKMGKLTPKLENCIYSVQCLDELDFLYAPYKKGSSKSKAEKARALGLESAAVNILDGRKEFVADDFIDGKTDGLKNYEQVIQGVQNIIADIFSKDEDVLNYLFEIEKQARIILKSTKIKHTSAKNSSSKFGKGQINDVDPERKFENYYDFQASIRNIQPHQVLALNRGESLKILSVKLVIDNWLIEKLRKFCTQKWLYRGSFTSFRRQIFEDAFTDSYERLICPFILRRARSELNRKAQHSAVESFAMNLKSLLQTPPIKGCPILGIDPGLKHGFKIALISGCGDVLWTAVFQFEPKYFSKTDETFLSCIKEKLIHYKCELIAIGNGTGCRIIEKKIGDCINSGFFGPDINVRYTIVNERGASIYSCSGIAKEEFPDLDPNLVSAVFIARSLQDPLNEFVKVEPKHLGVGMYQHDIPEKQLNAALDEIVQQCVSFIGVDVNTASIHLLKRIAGLGEARALKIIEWRMKNGPFKKRQQLTLVNQIGPKTFEQCSGFIRIHPQTAQLSLDNFSKTDSDTGVSKKINTADEYNPLDRTWIHPESYNVAYSFIELCKVNINELGTASFIDKVKTIVDAKGLSQIAAQMNQPEEKISFIAEALMKPGDYDYRCEFSKPIFRQGLTSINSITPGVVMTGVVNNVTNFGSFVDIGVGKSGLIHSSNTNGMRVQVGDRVEVKVISVEIERFRISLSLLKVL